MLITATRVLLVSGKTSVGEELATNESTRMRLDPFDLVACSL